MRRGRPTKTDSPPPAANTSPVTENNNISATAAKFESGIPDTSNNTKYDPFDPSHVRNKAKTPPATCTSPVASNTIPVGFQNSFTPENTSPITRVQSVPLSTPKPQLATKILQTQPNSPVKPERTSSSSITSTLEQQKTSNSSMAVATAENDIDEEDEDEGLPKMNKGVSSSIEARFMAIKNASRNSQPIKPSPTTSTNAKKNKPAPPPKPARFRSTATIVPSVDDFENKFPSLEDLDKSISS
jgi:fructose-specific phosphotransferase system component IIB